jgi:hypothetical protein
MASMYIESTFYVSALYQKSRRVYHRPPTPRIDAEGSLGGELKCFASCYDPYPLPLTFPSNKSHTVWGHAHYAVFSDNC